MTKASVIPRTSKSGVTTYRVMFRHQGRLRSTSFPTLRAAEQFERRVEKHGPEQALELLGARTQNVVKGAPTLAEWTEHHVEHLTGVTPGTRAEYRRLAARTFLPRLGEFPVDSIDRDAVAQWVNWLSEQITNRGTPTAPKTIRSAHGLLHSIFDSSVAADHRPDNPCHRMRLPKGEKFEGVFLTEAEFHAIVDATPEKHRPLVFTIGSTGMRWGEATAMTWRHVVLDGPSPSLRVVQAWKRAPNGRVLGPPKSAKSRRTVGLNADVVAVLRPLRLAAEADAEATGIDPLDLFVFRGQARNGNRNTAISHTHWHGEIWTPAVKRAGISKRVRIHDLRHSYASWLLAAGHDMYRVSAALGHESINTTTGVYGHIAPDAHRLTAEAIRQVLARELLADGADGDEDIVDGEVLEDEDPPQLEG